MGLSAQRWLLRAVLGLSAMVLLAGCAGWQQFGASARKETLHVLTKRMDLLTINAGAPRQIQKRVAVTGLAPGDPLVGIDYRVARGVLFAVSQRGVVYTLDAATGVLKPVSVRALDKPMDGSLFGVDFNPVADRIRVVSNTGFNIRLHPETGALAASDPPLAYAPGDAQAAFKPDVVAAAYTYNKKDEKLTTNYAIDRRAGYLVTQGSVERVQPVVSPNTGQLRSVGPLGLGPLTNAAFDIADVTGAAFAAVSTAAQAATRLYLVNLATGKAELLGIVGDGDPILGMAVEP